MADIFPANANLLLLISDPLMRTILQETLERAGYVVVSAGDVGAAVDRVKELRPDLLIIRPYVASMPGHMAAHYLRDRCPGLPVLIVTGYMDDERVRDQHELKEFYMFPKPFAREELLANVREVLRISHEKGR
jgi:two-component system, OmpR family, response regulator